jgi:hypothetical protein
MSVSYGALDQDGQPHGGYGPWRVAQHHQEAKDGHTVDRVVKPGPHHRSFRGRLAAREESDCSSSVITMRILHEKGLRSGIPEV